MNAPMTMETFVTRADLSDEALCGEIDQFVARNNGTVFHSSQWLRAVETATGQKASGLIGTRFGKINGWLPLTEVRSTIFGKALVSSGFAVGGGILAQDRSSVEGLAAAAQDYARQSGFGSIELRGGDIPDEWARRHDKHCGFVRSLADTDEAQLLSIPRKARAEVRKGLKNGLKVVVGRSPKDLADHYAVYSASVRNLGTPVFPRSLFRAMLEAFPDTSDILTVYSGDKPVSSVLSFYHDGAVMPYWGGGTLAARGLRANELMYYKLMLHARGRGMQKFDFGRSKTGSGPYKFKKNWGFEPEPLTYGEWSAGEASSRNIDPTDASFSRKIGLWKKLPLPAANLIGPWIARGLA